MTKPAHWCLSAPKFHRLKIGGVSEDLKSVLEVARKLLWSDWTPVTRRNLTFTVNTVMHPEGGCARRTKFDGVESSICGMTPDGDRPIFLMQRPTLTARSWRAIPIFRLPQFSRMSGVQAPEMYEAKLYNPIAPAVRARTPAQ